MTITNETYHKYNKLVHSITHRIARKYGLAHDDLIGEALVLFCKAGKSYNPAKGAFSTHLYHSLKSLHQTAQGIVEERNFHNYTDTFEQVLRTIDIVTERTELLDNIATELSSKAQRYLGDLFNGTFQEVKTSNIGRPQKFPVNVIKNHYGWGHNETMRVKNEITSWWRSY